MRLRVDSQRTQARNRDGQQQHYNQTNWRDRNEISSFYFTRFSDDVSKKDLWYQFKKWGDVREVFVSKQRNKNGRRYGFARFKGVNDVYILERQLDNIVIEGMKLYVNIPKYGRQRGRKTISEDKQKGQVQRNENEASRPIQRGARTNHGSYAEVVARKGNMKAPHSREGGLLSVYLETSSDMQKWFSEA